ncbi:M24 family metallopeptidase [Herpetosiphon llansteffanensis]
MSGVRIRRLASAARPQGMDYVVLMPGANLHYFTGLSLHLSERLALALIAADAQSINIVLPALEQPRALAEYSGEIAVRWFPWSDDEGPMNALRNAAAGLIGRTVGVEYTTMRVMELRALEEVAGIHSIDASAAIASLRMQKGSDEIELMREAVRIVEAGLKTAIEAIQPGRTEREIARIWEEAMQAAGGEGPSFATIVASGPNSANPHHTTGERQIQTGDLVILDGGALYRGYCSDITRTVSVGEPTEQQRMLYDTVLAANRAACAGAKPGMSGAQVDRLARQVVEDAELGRYFIHRTGHGLGMEIHEPPYIASTNKVALPIGTVFTVEPGTYVAGIGGVRIEDDVLLTANGAECLTNFPRELIVK